MWSRAAFIGLLASGVVAAGSKIQDLGQIIWPWTFWAILGVTLLSACLQRCLIERSSVGRIYDGLADLFVHIHTSSITDLPWKWAVRGVVSLLLAISSGIAGVEGPAIEFSYAFAARLRGRSERWFEQRKRTDSACALAAGISAAFGAPFAAILVPMEMGIGGRGLLAVVSSLFAFVGSSILGARFPTRKLDLSGALHGFGLLNWKEWAGVLAISAGAAVFGVIWVRFTRYCNRGFLGLSRGYGWGRMLFGGLVLCFIAFSYKSGFVPSQVLLEEVLWSRKIPGEAALAFFAESLALAVVLSSFGTLGLFWPLFSLGGLLGYAVYEAGFQDVSAFASAAGLVGASALWSAVLRTPIAAAVLVFEMTRNIQVLVPCLLGGLLACELFALLKGRGMIDASLEASGLALKGGRSLQVLEGIRVKDAMVGDHESVHEHDPVSELRGKLIHSRYPYLAVMNRRGLYEGILTLDMVREAWLTDRTVTSSHSSLSRLLEVKDLLYRSGFTVPTVRECQALSEVIELVDRYPCVCVLDEEGKLTGLLLAQNVRQAYEREVIRRSLDLVALGEGD